MLVDQSDYNTLHIFFDDQAHTNENSIVDVRDAITKEHIHYRKCNNMYVVKVEPHRAILEGDYFIKMIEFVERNRDDEIERVENGMPEEDDEEEDTLAEANKAWQDLQSLPNELYL